MVKLLTISIAAYNAEKYIRHCLETMVHISNIDNLEILVINDGSSDKTEEIATGYAVNYPDSVRVINKENGGVGSTYNAGMLNATGRYFKVVDADDWVDADNLDKLIDYLKNSDADMVLCHYCVVNINDEIMSISSCQKGTLDYNILYTVDEVGNALDLAMHAITFRTGMLREANIVFDENCFYVDQEYIAFPLKKVKTVVLFDFAVYMYLCGTINQSMNVNNFIKRRYELLRVIQSLIKLYVEIQDEVSVVVSNIVYTMITEQISTFIRLLLLVKDNKDRLKGFEDLEKVVFENEKLYKRFIREPGCKKNSIFLLLRKWNYVALPIVASVYKKHE